MTLESGMRLLLIATIPIFAACDGKYVTYTASFNVDETVQIRHTGGFAEHKIVSAQTFADIIDDIPANAEVQKVTITSLGADLNILSSTTASAVTLSFVASDYDGEIESLSVDQSVNIAAAQLALVFLADSKKQAKINRIKDRINAILASRNEANSSVTLGLAGSVEGGRLDADARVTMKVTVTYRVCENIGGELLATDASECSAGPLD